jgi:hypothetical protein
MLMQEKINGISSIYFEVEFWYHIGHHITSTPMFSHVNHVQVMCCDFRRHRTFLGNQPELPGAIHTGVLFLIRRINFTCF